jgi:tetratricopeptide (TPR) repeat protein
VIRTRLSRLTPGAITLLIAGAVLDHGFTFEQLCKVAHVGELEGLQALDEALAGRLLREAREEERRAFSGAYFFTHDKIRDVVYTEAGEARRRIFHRHALEVLQADHRPAAELVVHAQAAGIEEQTFLLSLAAGNEALRLFAVRTALAHYEQALQCLEEQWSVSDLPASISLSAVQELYTRLGRAHELLGETEKARSVYETMLALARTSQTPTMECAALNHLATVAAQNFTPENVEQALALLQQALLVAEQHNDRQGLAETEWNIAQTGVGRVDPHFILAHGERALVLARQIDTPELLGRCLNGITYARMMLAQWEEAIRLAGEAREVFRSLGNRAMEADCLAQIAVSSIGCGLLQECLDAAREAYAISVEIGSPWGQVNSMAPLSWGLLDRGLSDEAMALAQQAMALVSQHGLLMLYFPVIFTIGIAYRETGAFEEAWTTHLEGWPVAQMVGVPAIIEALASELCADYALAGNWEEAQKYAMIAHERRSDIFLMSSKRWFWYETEALVHAGQIEQAAQDAQRYGAAASHNHRYRIPYLRALAIIAQARGSIDEALAHLQEAAALAEAIDLPGERRSSLLALGELYELHGEQAQAQQAFKEAADIAQKLEGVSL